MLATGRRLWGRPGLHGRFLKRGEGLATRSPKTVASGLSGMSRVMVKANPRAPREGFSLQFDRTITAMVF